MTANHHRALIPSSSSHFSPIIWLFFDSIFSGYFFTTFIKLRNSFAWLRGVLSPIVLLTQTQSIILLISKLFAMCDNWTFENLFDVRRTTGEHNLFFISSNIFLMILHFCFISTYFKWASRSSIGRWSIERKRDVEWSRKNKYEIIISCDCYELHLLPQCKRAITCACIWVFFLSSTGDNIKLTRRRHTPDPKKWPLNERKTDISSSVQFNFKFHSSLGRLFVFTFQFQLVFLALHSFIRVYFVVKRVAYKSERYIALKTNDNSTHEMERNETTNVDDKSNEKKSND